MTNAFSIGSSAGTIDLTGYTQLIVAANFTINGGTFTSPSSVDINGALVISGGTFTAPSGTMTLAGSLTISGSPTFNHNNGTIIFDGTTTATLSCNNVTFNLVSFQHTSNTKTINSNCSMPLGNNPTLGLGTGAINLSGGQFSGSGTLSTASGFTIQNGGIISGFSGLAVGQSLQLSATTANNHLDLSGYSLVDVNLAIVVNSPTNPYTNILTAPNGEMTVGADFIISPGATFNHNNGTIKFDYTSGYVTCSGNTLNNVIIQLAVTSGTITVGSTCNVPLGNNPTILGRISINGTISGSGTITSGQNITIGSTGVLSGFSGLNMLSAFVSTFTLNGANLDLSGYSVANFNPTVINSGTITLPNNTDFNSNLSINGGTFTAPSGTMTLSGALTISGSPTFNHNNGTIIFDGTTTATLTCNNVTFNLVSFQHTAGTKTINSNCNMPVGSNPSLGASTGTGAITLSGGTIGGTGTLTTPLGTMTIQNGGVLSGFTGIVGRGAFTTLATTASTNLDLSGYTTADFNGAFTITAPTAPHTNTFIAPSGNLNLGSNVTLGTGINFSHSNGTIIFDGTTTATLICNNVVFSQANFSHTGGTKTLNSNCNLPLGNDPVIGVSSNASINVLGTNTLTGSGKLTVRGEIGIINSASNPLIGFDQLSAGLRLVVNNSVVNMGNYSFIEATALHIVNTNSIFTAPSGVIKLSRYMQNQGGLGSFLHNNGTVEFVGTSSELMQIWRGSSNFYNLTVDLTGKTGIVPTIGFTGAGTQTIQGVLTLKGTPTTPLTVQNLGAFGALWNIDAQGTFDIEYLEVAGSQNIGNIIQAGGRNVVNSGNNVGWNFDNPTVSNITIENQTNGYVKTQTPTIKFNLTDPETTDQVRYQIQIDNNEDFSSPEIDFTSELGTQGEKTHTTTNLNDGTYKMRIKGIDGSGGDGGYVNYQNELKIDTTSPQGSMFVGYTTDSTNKDIYIINKITDNLSGVSEMIISENPNFTNATWENYKESKIVRVSEGIGMKQINVKYKDQAGNESIRYKAGIEITQTPEENATIENKENIIDKENEEGVILTIFAIKIRDRNNNPLRNTIVRIQELGIEVRTDENGIAIFENIPLGSYNILGVTEEGEEFRYPIDITQETELITIEIEERSSPITLIAIVSSILLLVVAIVLSTMYFRKKSGEQ